MYPYYSGVYRSYNGNILNRILGQWPGITTGHKGPYDSQSVEGLGANAFYNEVHNFIWDGAVQFLYRGDNGYTDFKSALGYSSAKLDFVDKRYINGDNDGKVSLQEYEAILPDMPNMPNILQAIDLDGDGYISAGEDSALNMLIDACDGKSDGQLNNYGKQYTYSLLMHNLDGSRDFLEKVYDKFIKPAETDFVSPQMPELREINGEDGPNDSTTSIGKSKNAAKEIVDLYNDGDNDKVIYSNYTYMNNNDLSSGLAFWEEVMTIDDKDNDGVVKKSEVDEKIFDATDINKDGILSKEEYLARAIAIDTNSDGKISYNEKKEFNKTIFESDGGVDYMYEHTKNFYELHNLGQNNT